MKRALVYAMLALALSCAAGAKAPPAQTQLQRNDTMKDEIRGLWMQIREWRAEIDLRGVEPRDSMIQRYVHVSMHQLRQDLARMCEQPPEPSETCTDVCNIADNICENAEKICEIADQLPGDTWAEQKCASAKASCKEAKERCCSCESENGAHRPPANDDSD